MQLSDSPDKIVLPFAEDGGKNTIPVASQIGITPGAASYTDGFPPLTRTPVAAGGVPPAGLDMNGILYPVSAITRWANAGAGYVYDSVFATDSEIDGYPKGARIARTDGTGYWLNTVDGNDVDPESTSAGVAAAAGWVPDFTNGIAAVTMTNANVTLTPSQYGKPVIVISGVLLANVNLIFPAIVGQWAVINNTTGAFTITCKTASGTGIIVNYINELVGDGTNIYNGNSDAFASYSTVTQVSSGTTVLTAKDIGKVIQCTGTATVTLPSVSAVSAGGTISFFTASSTLTINRAGSDSILSPSGTITSLIISTGSVVLTSQGSSGNWLVTSGPTPSVQTTQKFTSGSGTYTTPARVRQILVRMVAGGGGSGGGGTGGGSGGTGGTTTFNSITAVGGSLGVGITGGAGGTGGTGTATLRCPGSGAAGGLPVTNGTTGGGIGGSSAFAGGGSNGTPGAANTGGGAGGGAATGGTAPTGGGGGGGEYAEILISNPASSYSYSVGAGGTAGSAGTNGAAGQIGGSGVIFVTEFY